MNFETLQLNELQDIFNDHLNELLDQLQNIVNNLNQHNLISRRSKANLEFYKNLIMKGQLLNKEIVIESFGSYILQEPETINHIVNKNDEYFLNFNYNSEVNDTNIQELILILKDTWKHLGKENTDIVFEYFQILCQVTVAYAKKKYT